VLNARGESESFGPRAGQRQPVDEAAVRRTAERLAAASRPVLYVGGGVNGAGAGAELLALAELLRRSDYVSLHAPANAQTRRIIGERELGLMKPSTAIFNTARGDLIDEQALYRALVEKRIAVAGLDVFEQEPAVADTRASSSRTWWSHPRGRLFGGRRPRWVPPGAAEMVRLLSGRWPRNTINLEVRRTDSR
jgi:D-3-phosphoglycerate dehydrogenase